MTPTAEQQAIIDFVCKETGNLIIEARAGAAKTTTIQMAINALPPINTLYLAFNKKIADEAEEKLPSTCRVQTLHSFCLSAWRTQVQKFPKIDSSKMYKIIKELLEYAPELRENIGDLLNTCSLAKQVGFVPPGHFISAKPTVSPAEFFDNICHLEHTDEEIEIITQALIQSVQQGLQCQLDFDDMIYLPAVFPCSFPRYPIIFLDEAQDFTELNHILIKKIVRNSRLVACGDPYQAIYGFRGAHADSMGKLRINFNMELRTLTCSFRCPVSVVELARRIAPDMTYPDWAIAGRVTSPPELSINDIPDSAIILCRNNAPLFKFALKLLKAKRKPEFTGQDVLRNIQKQMKKFGKPGIRIPQLLTEINKWYEKERKRNRSKATLDDIRSTYIVLTEGAETLKDVLSNIDQLINATGGVKLSTVHKAKGLEFDDVYILDDHLFNPEVYQDENVWYVAVTRSKANLTFIQSGDVYLD